MNRVADALKRVHYWRGPQPDGVAADGVHSDGSRPEAGPGMNWGRAPAGPDNGGRLRADPYERSVVIAGDSRYTRASDQFQVLCALLESLRAGQDKHLFAVTSALGREGKSFVALNLAVALACSGARALLIDASLNNPSLHRALRVDGRGGLSEYLGGNASFETVIRATAISGLALIPGGAPLKSSAAELFAHPRMLAFVAAARTAYAHDFVIIDCPSVLIGAEAQIVARMADALVMVVAANRTPRDDVTRALSRLRGGAISAMVLNRMDPSYSRWEYPAASEPI